MSKSRYDITTLMVEDIEKLTDPECRSLSVGDLVVLEDGGDHYLYSVAYKDSGTIELRGLLVDKVDTVSYAYNEETKKWEYDSTTEEVFISEKQVVDVVVDAFDNESTLTAIYGLDEDDNPAKEPAQNFPKVHDMDGMICGTTDVSEFEGIKVGDVIVDNQFVFVGIVNQNDEEYFEAYGIQDDLATAMAVFDKTNLEWHVPILEVGTHLYKHHLTLDNLDDCVEIVDNSSESITTSNFDARVREAVSLYYEFLDTGSIGGAGRPILLTFTGSTIIATIGYENGDAVTDRVNCSTITDAVTPL